MIRGQSEWIASYVDKVSATRQVADTQANSHANTDNANNTEHSVVEPSTRLVNKISVDVAPTRTVAHSLLAEMSPHPTH